jgi:predicted acylesterase/phospholipase RssA/CRP-like cAMP-binding protein
MAIERDPLVGASDREMRQSAATRDGLDKAALGAALAGGRAASTAADCIVNWLRSSRFCEGVEDGVLLDVAREVNARAFQDGDILACAGDEATTLMILAEGAIKATFRDVKGHEHVMGYVNPGDHAGDVSLLERTPRPVTFVAEAGGTLLEIPAAAFHHLIDTHGRLLRNLFRTLGGRFREYAGMARRRPSSPVVAVAGVTLRLVTLVRRLMERLSEDGERLCVWSNEPDRLRFGDRLPTPRRIGTDLPAAIRRFREDFPAGVDRHVVVTLAESWPGVSTHGLIAADEVQWVVEPGDHDRARRHLHETAALVPKLAERTRLVWLLDPGSAGVAPRTEGWGLGRLDIKVPLGPDSAPTTLRERQGIDRLLRALRGYSFGLALAGGGARGMAHLGVLRALDEAGIGFDMISGTSSGAMVGIVYAAGIDPDWAVEQFRRDLTPPRLLRALPRGRQWFLLMQFRRGAWDRMLRNYLHDWRLEQLAIPAFATAVDLVTARDVVRDRGDAVEAILESINLPGIARPIMRDGMALVDGGVLNNLPADVLADRGIDFVVGVDVSSRLRPEFAGIGPGREKRPRRAGTVETLFRVFEAQAHGLGNVRNRAVDFWITPDTAPFDFTDFTRASELAAAGASAASAIVPRLRQQLAEFERRLMTAAGV